MFNGEKTECFLTKISNKTRISPLTVFIQDSNGGLVHAIRQGKKIQIRKEELTLSLFAESVKSPKESAKLLELNGFSTS